MESSLPRDIEKVQERRRVQDRTITFALVKTLAGEEVCQQVKTSLRGNDFGSSVQTRVGLCKAMTSYNLSISLLRHPTWAHGTIRHQHRQAMNRWVWSVRTPIPT